MNRWMLYWICFGLSGCMLGPNFKGTPPSGENSYAKNKIAERIPSSGGRHGETQFIKTDLNIPKEWWSIFQSKPLDQIIKTALANNPDLHAASAALKMAHEDTQIQRAAFFPQAGLSYQPSRQLTPGTYASNLISNAYLYTTNYSALNITYAPDVLGLNRRKVESLLAQEQMTSFQKDAVQLTLTSNLVLAAIQEANLSAQIQATESTIKLAQELLTMMKKQYELGQIGHDLVIAQATHLSEVESALPPLKQALAQQEHQMALLIGLGPAKGPDLIFTLNNLTLPKKLPLVLPSELLRKRPDIQAAEAALHAACANIGVAYINRFPNISISAVAGFVPVDFSPASIPTELYALPALSNGFWSIGANLAATVFSGGALMHQQRKAEAAYELTFQQYRKVVLQAFQEVADTLKAIEYDGKALTLAAKQLSSAKEFVAIAKKKWQLGAISYLEVLAASEALQRAQLQIVQIESQRLSDTALLFQAVGGGWG